MERAMEETTRRREKQLAWNEEHGITPQSVKANIADILDSVYERDHVRADITGAKGGAKDQGALIGNNLEAHIKALETQMRDAAADLDFETAARLRDEIKRLRETELAVMDDALARNTGIENTRDSRKRTAQGKPPKGSKPAPNAPSSPGSSRGPIPETDATGDAAESYFRKNTLDEMTVGRTEKPVGTGKQPQKPVEVPSKGDDNAAKPVKRHKIGVGSYEDPADERARKRKPGKTGRPGR
jgi:excinuclease ABC subunit B